ncbi:hypothetical protein H4Q26_003371 [Puccinia striiformis f. sp. tritici PST-130]|nr:hypothetical protein H4Q26_003371 [Puccinia striiformis f. sp. tritici PST-130]
MIAHHVIFIALISLLPTESLAVDKACYKDHAVLIPKDCDGCNLIALSEQEGKAAESHAIKNIIFDTTTKPPQLFLNEGEVRTISGGCSLVVNNPSRAIVTEASIRKAVDALIKQCPGKGGKLGFSDNPKVVLEIRQRAPPGTEFEGYNPDFPLEKPYCFQVPKGKPEVTDQRACIDAFAGMFTDTAGVIMGDDKKPTNTIVAGSNKCTLYMFTTDQSRIKVVQKDAAPLIVTMLQQCGTKSGTLNLKGAEGANGRVIVRTYGY